MAKKQSSVKNKMINEAYERHLIRVERMKCKVDTHLSLQKANKIIKLAQLKIDADRHFAQNNANYRLVVAINRILRTTGQTKSFGKPKNYESRRSRVPEMKANVRRLHKANIEFGMRLNEVKPRVQTRNAKTCKQRLSEKKARQKMHAQRRQTFMLPDVILEKYGDNIQVPTDISLQRQLFRPVLFFDIEVKGLRAFGRVVIQLFTEACPEAVLQLVRICASKNNKRISIPRVFPDLWVGCEMLLDGQTMSTNNIEYDMRALDHGSQGGILSIPLKSLQGCPNRRMPFSISVRPLSILNNRRLAFGRVVRGLDIINALEEFGSKNGVLSKHISVTQIGLVH